MLVQLVCAAYTLEFQGLLQLVQAMPAILPSLVTLTVCVYVLEFMRWDAFLQTVRQCSWLRILVLNAQTSMPDNWRTWCESYSTIYVFWRAIACRELRRRREITQYDMQYLCNTRLSPVSALECRLNRLNWSCGLRNTPIHYPSTKTVVYLRLIQKMSKLPTHWAERTPLHRVRTASRPDRIPVKHTSLHRITTVIVHMWSLVAY